MNINNVPEIYGVAASIFIVAVAIWTTPWKGVALWKAARNGQLGWFIALLLLNTLAILEIVYIFFFQKKKEQAINPSNTSSAP